MSSMPSALVHIVIVNWNAGALLSKCVDSIASGNCGLVDRVTVVDNGSIDGSVDDLIAQGVELDIVRAGSNLGFGRACNVGVKRSRAPYILFLNPDAALHSGTLNTVLAFMESVAAKGIAACGIRLVDEEGVVQHHTTGLPEPWTIFTHGQRQTKFDHLESRLVGHVIGAFYMIRRSVFEALKGFDERFFLYLEDLDLSVRVQRAGWTVHYLSEATSFHKGGGTSEQVKAHRLYYSLQSRILFAFKHFTSPQAWSVLGVTLTVELAARVVRSLARGSLPELSHTARGYRMLVCELPSILRKALDSSAHQP
jgi:GT2 family glycosyltransferase